MGSGETEILGEARGALLALEQPKQIAQDCKIRSQQAEAHHRRVANQLPQLPGQEHHGEAQRQILGPDLFEHQADTFGKGQCGVGESAESNLAKPMHVDKVDLCKHQADEAAFGIKPQRGRKSHGFITNIFV